MIPAGSRYEESVTAFVSAHLYDEYGRLLLDGDNAVPVPRILTREATYRLKVPGNADPSPLEYQVVEGETLPFLAWKLTRRHGNWWKIAEANPNVWYPLDLPPGTKLRIPE